MEKLCRYYEKEEEKDEKQKEKCETFQQNKTKEL